MFPSQPRAFTLKFSGLYPPTANLTNAVPLWYMEIASGYPKTLREKKEQEVVEETYQKIISDLYAADECIGWTFWPFVEKRLREYKPKISHQSVFYSPPLSVLPTIVRGTPSDNFPFFLNLTFAVNMFATGSTVEFTFPHVLIRGDGAPASERYNPFLREFLTPPPPELVKTAVNDRTLVQLPDVKLQRQTPVNFYMAVPPLSSSGSISPIWSEPFGSVEYLSTRGWGLVVRNRKDKELLSTFSFPAPIFNRRMIGGIAGPDFQRWSEGSNLEMATFRLQFGSELPKGKIRIVLSVLSNPLDAVEGVIMNRKDQNTCTAIFRGPEPLVVEVVCPELAQEKYQIDVSMPNGERSFPVGWYVLGVVPNQDPNEIAWFKIAVYDGHKRKIYDTSLLSDRKQRMVQQEPCINRYSIQRIKHRFTGYTSRIRLTMQLFNCFSASQPLRPMPLQVEPLEARVPVEETWSKREYFSSVSVYRPNRETYKTNGSAAPLQRAMAQMESRAEKRQQKECSASDRRFALMELDRLDPPAHINVMKEPKWLPSSPALAAASVHYNFPTAEQAGIPRPPSMRKDAPAHRNPMSMHISRKFEEEQSPLDIIEPVRIAVHIVLDEAFLDDEAINAFKRFVARKIDNPTTAILCSKIKGIECFVYSWTTGSKVVSWETGEELRVPDFDDPSIPPESGSRDVFDQLRTIVHQATAVPCNGKAARMSWVILFTHHVLASNYEVEVAATNPPTYSLHDKHAHPLHVMVIGWNPNVPEEDQSVQQRLQALPFSPVRGVFLGAMQDTRMQALSDEPVFISFVFPAATEVLAGHVPALQQLEEVLFLIQEEYAESFVVVDICRHPLPPEGYVVGDYAPTRAKTADDLTRPIELLYNGIVIDRLNWTISAAEVGVYTAAKLSWQFDMACDGDNAAQDTS
ncbi:hypothetical protein CSUI_005636 [Cystoisospora suis]|uniref:Uncharacterized protein n=1 Tax=Cystoisospora suis TaxID=483139 RepID=A0A2C6KX94_9APIC|nr:hypothetical protein CSUI_005636 [Cystoisospora suis]